MKTLYEVLGVRADDDAETLKKAFRKAVKATHPDVHTGDPDAPSRFRLVVAANAILRDTRRRAAYDRLLQQSERQQLLAFGHGRPPRLERQRLRSRWLRAVISRTAAVAAVSVALMVGLELFAPIARTAVVVKRPRVKVTEVVKEPVAKVTEVAKATVTEAIREPQAKVTEAAKEPEATVADAVNAGADRAGGMTQITVQPAAQINPTGPVGSQNNNENAEVPDRAIESTAAAPATNRGEVIAEQGPAHGIRPNDAKFHREQGIVSYRTGDLARAIVAFDEAIRLDPNDAQSYNIRGNAWDEIGSFDRALADYDQAIRIDPNNPAVFHDRAILWQHTAAFDKALVDLDRAIRFSFSDAHIYCDRGLVWYEKGRHDRAIADFNRAAKIDPNLAVACINRGLILHRDREFNLASAEGGKTIRVDPGMLEEVRRTKLRP